VLEKSISFKHQSEGQLDVLISYPIFQQDDTVENLLKLLTTYMRTHGYKKVPEL
jgi:hypothetical protein